MIGDRAIAGLAALAAIACAGGMLAQTYRLSRAELALAKSEKKLATEQRGREADRATAAGVAASAIAAYRAEEQRRTAAMQENVNAARQEADRAVRDHAAAERAAAGLRRDFRAAAAAAARCRSPASDPSTSAGGAPATGAADLLADVFDEMERAGRAMAIEAQKRGIAGTTCERAHDSLTTP